MPTWRKAAATTFVAPAEEIQTDGTRYIVRLAEIRDDGVSKGQFVDPADPDPPHTMRWVADLFHIDGTPVLDTEGNVYQHHELTSNRIGKGKTRTAKAREYMEVFLQRELDESEIDDTMSRQLVGKMAVVLFEGKERETQDGTPYTRYSWMKIYPYKRAPAAAGSAPMPQAAAIPPRNLPEQPGELPWNN